MFGKCLTSSPDNVNFPIRAVDMLQTILTPASSRSFSVMTFPHVATFSDPEDDVKTMPDKDMTLAEIF